MNLSYSKLQDLQNCPRKYYYNHVERIRKIEEAEEEHDKAWGIAMHEALASYYKEGQVEKARAAFTKNYPLHLDEADLAKTPETGQACLDAYIPFWREQDKMWDVIGTEIEDSFDLNGVAFEVHADMLIRHKQEGRVFVVDHKTSGRVPTVTYWSKFDLSDQVSAYTYWANLRHGDCGGFIVNNISVGHRQRAYKGEPAGSWFKFERNTFSRSKAQLEAWQNDVKDWSVLLDYHRASSTWPKHTGELCGWCNYRELCLSAEDEEIKDLMYERKKEMDR